MVMMPSALFKSLWNGQIVQRGTMCADFQSRSPQAHLSQGLDPL